MGADRARGQRVKSGWRDTQERMDARRPVACGCPTAPRTHAPSKEGGPDCEIIIAWTQALSS